VPDMFDRPPDLDRHLDVLRQAVGSPGVREDVSEAAAAALIEIDRLSARVRTLEQKVEHFAGGSK
jgi:hypothetical protein